MKEDIEAILDKAWTATLKFFYHPALRDRPKLVDNNSMENESQPCPTAYFNFKNNEIKVNLDFLDVLNECGLTKEEALTGVLKHEVGHYAFSPRDLATILWLGDVAMQTWKEKYAMIMNYYEDVQLNLEIMLRAEGGKELRNVYTALQQYHSKFVEERPDLKERVRLDKVITALYQYHTGHDFGVGELVDQVKQLKKSIENKKNVNSEQEAKKMNLDPLAYKLFQLLSVNYQNWDRPPEEQWPHLAMFGEIINDLLPEPPKSQCKGKGQHTGGGHGFDDNSPTDYTSDQVEDALDVIASKYGKARYERIKKYAEDLTGKSFDKNDSKIQSSGAGLESSEIKNNDGEIPYYERRARTFPLHIIKKPVRDKTNDFYPMENKEYSVGDPVNKINKFATKGKFLPGITKRRDEKSQPHEDKLFKIPDLFICIDSSGSMPSPEQGSPAVTAGFVAARNYHRNGAKVGVMNFSADSAFLLPTRELRDVYSMLCGYWGGGTALNTDKVRQYFDNIGRREKGKKIPSAYATDQKDYEKFMKNIEKASQQEMERIVERLDPEDQKKLRDKNINIKIPKERRQICEKLDNLIISDGDIHNLPEVIRYLNELAPTTRNTCIITQEFFANQWKRMNLPNTQIIYAATESDLYNITIGKVKRLHNDA